MTVINTDFVITEQWQMGYFVVEELGANATARLKAIVDYTYQEGDVVVRDSTGTYTLATDTNVNTGKIAILSRHTGSIHPKPLPSAVQAIKARNLTNWQIISPQSHFTVLTNGRLEKDDKFVEGDNVYLGTNGALTKDATGKTFCLGRVEFVGPQANIEKNVAGVITNEIAPCYITVKYSPQVIAAV